MHILDRARRQNNFLRMARLYSIEFHMMYSQPMDNYANELLYLCSRLACTRDAAFVAMMANVQ